MKEAEVVIPNKLGVHMRPAAMIADTAVKYSCDTLGEYNGMIANLKSILSIVMLVLEQGARIKLITSGVDEEEAFEALKNLLESGFGEM